MTSAAAAAAVDQLSVTTRHAAQHLVMQVALALALASEMISLRMTCFHYRTETMTASVVFHTCFICTVGLIRMNLD